MQLTDGYRLIALRDAQHFLANHADDLARVLRTGAARRLDSILDELSCLATEQAEATLLARGATGRLRYLRRRLYEDHLSPITRVARVELEDHPELLHFRMPRSTLPIARLTAVVSGMARAAAPHAALFIAAGLPEDFVARLEEAMAELLETYRARASWRSQVGGATVGITIRLADGRRTVAALDSFVRSATRGRPELYDAWRQVRTIAALPGRRRLRSSVPDDTSVRLTATTTPLLAAPPGDTLLPHQRALFLPGPSGQPESTEPPASAPTFAAG